MVKSTYARAALTALAAIIIAAAAYSYGAYVRRTEANRAWANGQAMLAFAQYKSYERIELLLLRKCYEAALTEARELKNLQVTLVSENLRASGNDSGLMEYIKMRDPKLLQTILAGRVPELKPYTTTCP